MKVIVNFGQIAIIVPCGSGDLLVRDVIQLAIDRYKKATSKVCFVFFSCCHFIIFIYVFTYLPSHHLNTIIIYLINLFCYSIFGSITCHVITIPLMEFINLLMIRNLIRNNLFISQILFDD